jgi:hypothetical protein
VQATDRREIAGHCRPQGNIEEHFANPIEHRTDGKTVAPRA